MLHLQNNIDIKKLQDKTWTVDSFQNQPTKPVLMCTYALSDLPYFKILFLIIFYSILEFDLLLDEITYQKVPDFSF